MKKIKTFIYLSFLLKNLCCIHELVKCRLKLKNTYYLIQNLLFSLLTSKNFKIKIHKNLLAVMAQFLTLTHQVATFLTI